MQRFITPITKRGNFGSERCLRYGENEPGVTMALKDRSHFVGRLGQLEILPSLATPNKTGRLGTMR
jgi:hypothetical protein